MISNCCSLGFLCRSVSWTPFSRLVELAIYDADSYRGFSSQLSAIVSSFAYLPSHFLTSSCAERDMDQLSSLFSSNFVKPLACKGANNVKELMVCHLPLFSFSISFSLSILSLFFPCRICFCLSQKKVTSDDVTDAKNSAESEDNEELSDTAQFRLFRLGERPLDYLSQCLSQPLFTFVRRLLPEPLVSANLSRSERNLQANDARLSTFLHALLAATQSRFKSPQGFILGTQCYQYSDSPALGQYLM